MNITVTIDKIIEKQHSDSDNVKAYASATLDNDFVVHGIMICRSGSDGELTLQMPWRHVGNQITDAFHALNTAARQQLFSAVLDEYERRCNNAN